MLLSITNLCCCKLQKEEHGNDELKNWNKCNMQQVACWHEWGHIYGQYSYFLLDIVLRKFRLKAFCSALGDCLFVCIGKMGVLKT